MCLAKRSPITPESRRDDMWNNRTPGSLNASNIPSRWGAEYRMVKCPAPLYRSPGRMGGSGIPGYSNGAIPAGFVGPGSDRDGRCPWSPSLASRKIPVYREEGDNRG